MGEESVLNLQHYGDVKKMFQLHIYLKMGLKK